jgi:surfactin synthase thioesterase subunit
MKKTKLFCLPYAGGSATIYEKWKRYLHPSIELIGVDYSGRGRRFSEPLFDDFKKIVDDIFFILKDEITNSPYSIFGHSMGALVAYELAYKIQKEDLPMPIHIFLSGKGAPQFSHRDKMIHNLDNHKFKEELLKLDGTPKEVLENDALMEIFLPILKSDFKAIEEYTYFEKAAPIDCNFTILYGKDEKMPINKISEWQVHTKNKCNFFSFSGGHFFLHDHSEDIVSLINNTIAYHE